MSNRIVKPILILSILPFLGFGIFMIRMILHMMNGKNNKMAIPFIIFVLFIVAVPVVQLFFVLRKLKQNPAGAGAPPRPEKPWLARPDWTSGRIKSSAGADWGGLTFIGLVFTGLGAIFTIFVIPKELHNGNYLALVILIFPAVGVYSQAYVALQRRGQRHFGETLLVMASVSGVPGNAMQGSIQTGASFRPQEGVHLRLSCIRRTVNRGKDRSVTEIILWQDEKILKNESVSAHGDHAGIPVYFQLPADQPECFNHGNEAVIWRLNANAKMAGPDFKAAFDLPVFNVTGAATPVIAPDPTEKLQMPVEEIRRDEHSKIRISNAPGGREFYFPAARNPGMAFVVTLLAAIFSGAVWFMVKMKAMLLFPIVFGLFDLIFIYSAFNTWFKRACVTINATGVRVSSHWLIFGRNRFFDASNVAHFDSKSGTQSGQHVYYDIQIVTRDGRKSTVANLVPNKPETEWLVQEMNKAAGRSK